MAIRRGFADIGGAFQVHYRTAGAGGPRPLIILHPSPGSSKMMEPLIEAYAASRTVYGLDTLGNGDSSPPDLPAPDLAWFARGHMAAIDALEIDEFDLRPWLAADAQPPSGADGVLQQPVPRFTRLPLDVDLSLELPRWTGLPVELSDLKLELQADARGLRMPLQATVAGAAVSGRLDLDTAAATPRLALQLASNGLAPGDPAAGR